MNKRNLLLTLILFSAVTLGTVKTYAEEVEQTINLSVQPFVSIEKQTGSVDSDTVNAATGIHNGLSTIFNIETNGTDDDYDFTITSILNTSGETTSAYSANGYLLFGHLNNPPTEADVANAKEGGNNNKNGTECPPKVKVK